MSPKAQAWLLAGIFAYAVWASRPGGGIPPLLRRPEDVDVTPPEPEEPGFFERIVEFFE